MLVIATVVWILYYFNIIPAKVHKGEEFNIQQVKSSVDYNQNGVDDYTDIMLGARKDAENAAWRILKHTLNSRQNVAPSTVNSRSGKAE